MREVLTLQEHPHPDALRQTPAFGDGSRPTDVAAQQRRVLGAERIVAPRVAEVDLELRERGHERLRCEAPAELAEATKTFRLGAG